MPDDRHSAANCQRCRKADLDTTAHLDTTAPLFTKIVVLLVTSSPFLLFGAGLALSARLASVGSQSTASQQHALPRRATNNLARSDKLQNDVVEFDLPFEEWTDLSKDRKLAALNFLRTLDSNRSRSPANAQRLIKVGRNR